MEEELFNQMVSKDLKKVNELVLKGHYDTSDFERAALTLSNSLSMYCQEINNEVRKKRKCLQKSKLA